MVMAAAMLVLAGCSSTESVLGSLGLPGTSSSQPSNLVGTPPGQAATNSASAIDPQSNCPVVDVRQGASTFVINAPGADRNVLDLRYQGTISKLARECILLGASMRIKVGVEGRVILGPAGGPGEVIVPLRFALVREGIEPKTIASNFYRVPVNIPPGEGNVPFTHVEQNLTFATPPLSELENYVVYVGFDTQMLEQKPRKPRKARKPAPRRQR